MRMGGAWGHYACVRGFGKIAEKTSKNGGARHRVRSRIKEECQRKIRSKKVLNFLLFLVDTTSPRG